MKLKKQYIKILQKAFKVWSNKLDDYDLRYAMDEIYYAKSPPLFKSFYLLNMDMIHHLMTVKHDVFQVMIKLNIMMV